MFKKLKVWLAYQSLRVIYRADAIVFNKALSCVKETQLKILLDTLNANVKTEIGKKYGFSSIRDVKRFKKQVPISNFADYESYVERIALGRQNVLTQDPVLVLEPSSGSTAPSKYVPYTQRLRKEYRRALAPWIYNLISCYPHITSGTAYWSITPVTHCTKQSPGGISVGFKDDSEYFGKFARFWIKKIFTIPQEVSQLEDITVFRYVTLLFLLKDRDLSFISVWNPSFLTLLLEPLWEWRDMLIQDIDNGTIASKMVITPDLRKRLVGMLSSDPNRAQELRYIFEECQLAESKKEKQYLYKLIWPKLSLISCWTDGNAALYISELKSYFPDIQIQPKGLIATEAIISIPLFGQKAGVLAVNSHFFEFIELTSKGKNIKESSDTKLAHEVEVGKRYSVIVTTGGGLYRYHMQDYVEVIGYLGQCPVITFIGKSDKIVDLCGEKLNEQFVASILEEVFAKHKVKPTFFMVAPCQDTKNNYYHYSLFLQVDQSSMLGINALQEINIDVEQQLRKNFHYDYCRNLGQLQPIKIFLISPECQATSMYLHYRNRNGQRLGGIKPSVVDKGMNWQEIFYGSFVNEHSSLSRI
jgi:hypothetical protein